MALGLLMYLAFVQVTSARLETQTWDEAIHLAAGFSYWRTGDYRMNPEHPPLGKLLNAIPLLFMDIRLPLDGRPWQDRDETEFGAVTLYANRRTAEEILFPARCVTIALTVLFGAAVAFWTRLRFGSTAALIALAFFVFDPNLTAHGRYVTTDLAVSLLSFVACALWCEALLRKRSAWTIAAGAALGFALGAKFSALFLLPVFVLLAVVRWPGMKHAALALLCAGLVLEALYWPEVAAGARKGAFRFPPKTYKQGLHAVRERYREGQDSYLMGRISKHGWWYYFPVVFLVKTPTAAIGSALLAVALALRRRWWRISLPVLAAVLPLLVYGGSCLFSSLDLGIRHLLPIYPFLYLLTAAALVRYVPRWAITGLIALLVLESVSIYPHYLAFFNWPSGGPGNGPHWLVESNLDWGQDVLKLKSYLEANHMDKVCTAYFGSAYFVHYGIPEGHVPYNGETKQIRDLDCMAAVSATVLYGLYMKDDPYRWLRDGHQPLAKVGYSIYVYDLRRASERVRQ